MADTTVTASTNVGVGALFAVDDGGAAGVFPYAKVAFGGSGTQTEVSTSNGLPVAQQGTWNIATVTAVTGITNALPAGTNVIGHVIVDSGTITTVSTVTAVTTVSTVTSLTQMNGQAIAMGTGVRTAGTQRVTIATDDSVPVTGTITANMGTVTADPFGANADAASATGSISAKLRFIAATGIPITSGTITTVSTVTAVTAITNALPAGTNNIGGATQQPLSTGGLTWKSFVSAASNNKASIGAACRIYAITIFNIGSVPVYLKCFNAASGSVTAGATNCDFQFGCPANSTAANGAGTNIPIDASGIGMATDFTYLLTAGIGTADNTSTSANVAVVTIGYK